MSRILFVRERVLPAGKNPCPLKVVLYEQSDLWEWIKELRDHFHCEYVSSMDGRNLNDVTDGELLDVELSDQSLLFLEGCKKEVNHIPLYFDVNYPQIIDEWVTHVMNTIVHETASRAARCSRDDFHAYFLHHYKYEGDSIKKGGQAPPDTSPMRYLTNACCAAIDISHMEHSLLNRYGRSFIKSAKLDTHEQFMDEERRMVLADKIARYIKAEILRNRDVYKKFLYETREMNGGITEKDKYDFFSQVIKNALDDILHHAEDQSMSGHHWIFHRDAYVPEHPTGFFIGKTYAKRDEDDVFGDAVVIHDKIECKKPWNEMVVRYPHMLESIRRITGIAGGNKVIVLWIKEKPHPYIYYDANGRFQMTDKEVRFETLDEYGQCIKHRITKGKDTNTWFKGNEKMGVDMWARHPIGPDVAHVIFFTNAKPEDFE